MLKEHYSDDVREGLANNLKCPAHGMIKEKKNVGGKFLVQPLEFDTGGGGSSGFTEALANDVASNFDDFEVTRMPNYQFAHIDNETMEASMGNINAFKPAMEEVGRKFKAAGMVDARGLFGTKGNKIGQIASTTVLASTQLELTSWTDAIKFHIGDQIVLSATNGGGTVKAGTPLVVQKVDLRNGYITVDQNISTAIATAALLDFVFREGDYDMGMSGFADWIPDDRTTLATPFFGVDRSQWEERMAGMYIDGTGAPYDEVLIELASLVAFNGGNPNVAFMNHRTLSQLIISWQSKRRVDKTEVKGKSGIGFKGFTVTAGSVELTLYADVFCDLTDLYVLDWDTWCKFSAGGSPKFLLRGAGGKSSIEPDPNADRWRCRVGGYRNVSCSDPGSNGRATIDAPSI